MKLTFLPHSLRPSRPQAAKRQQNARALLALALLVMGCILAVPGSAIGQMTLEPPIYRSLVDGGPPQFLFLTPNELIPLEDMRVGPGKKVRTLFDFTQEIHVHNTAGHNVQPGDELFVVKLQKKVHETETRKFLGSKTFLESRTFLGRVARFTARLRVEGIDGQELRTRVMQTSEEISLNDFVVPVTAGEPLPLTKELLERKRMPKHGRIVATKDDAHLFAEGSIVFLDVGADHGVRSGMELPIVAWTEVRVEPPEKDRRISLRRDNRISQIVRRVELPLKKDYRPRDALLRREHLGTLRATLVRNQFSTAVVTRFLRDIEIGDHVELPGASMQSPPRQPN